MGLLSSQVFGGAMTESNRTEQLLTEIRDLLAAHEQRYSDYLARVEELSKTQATRTQENIKQVSRSRIGLFLLALVIGIMLWAFMLYVIIRMS
jgi:hypothetical protein